MCDLKIFSNQQMIAGRPGPSWVPRKKHTFQKPNRDKEGENGSKKKKSQPNNMGGRGSLDVRF